MNEDRLRMQRFQPLTDLEVEELPLAVVPDWDEQLRRATRLCRLIDRHLEYEAQCRGLAHRVEFQPRHLCAEQRVDLVTDLYAEAL